MSQSIELGKVKLAMARLASRHPFQAGVLSCMRIVEDSSIATMAIGFDKGRLTLLFSPQFVADITMDETEGVLCHEALHVILGHVDHVREEGENRQAMTIAEEVSVNALVDGPLPGNPILLEQYPCLPPRDESTEDRYERLLADTRPHPDPETTDDHNTWRRQVQDAGPLASLAASAAVAGAWGGLTPDQRSEVPQRVAEAAKAAVQQSTATVDWRKVLERYVGRSLTRRPTYNRPPRRFPEMVGIIPGRMQGVGSPRVLACIDTSGSISPADIADFSSELGRMARSCVVTVVFFDERVRDVFSYRKFSEVTGRGGTDFRPILKPDFLRNHRTDCVVIFTDGQGPAPALKPCVPVVWCLTGRGRSPVAWGKSIAISGT